MTDLQCRLCSSKTALISLFNGKSRRNRDYIRKLTDITTGVKFQKEDAYKCICFSCTIQIYNFYIFRARSIENDKRLQVCNKTSQKIKSHKIEILDLDEIALPDIEELKENLMPWLVSKQQYCNVGGTETDKNVVNNSNEKYCNEIKHKPELIDSSTQYESIKSITRETQWESSLIDACTETNKLITKNVKTQCNEYREAPNETTENFVDCPIAKKLNKVIQCTVPTFEISTQTMKLTMKSSKVQCHLLKTNQVLQEMKMQESFTQTSEESKRSFSVKSFDTSWNDLGNVGHKKDENSLSKYMKPKTRFTKRSQEMLTTNKDQCSLIERSDKESQYELSSVEIRTQTEGDLFTGTIGEYKAKDPVNAFNNSTSCEPYIEKQLKNKLASKTSSHQTRSSRISEDLLKKNGTRVALNKVPDVGCNLLEKADKESRQNLACEQSYTDLEKLLTNTTKAKRRSEILNISEIPNNKDKNRLSKSTIDNTPKNSFGKEVQSSSYVDEETKLSSVVKMLPNSSITGNSPRKRRRGKFKTKGSDSSTQTDFKCKIKGVDVPYSKFFGNINMPNSIILPYLNVKQEVQTSPMLSPANCLSISIDGTKTEPLSAGFGCVSPASSNLLTISSKIENVIICPECDQTLYSKNGYKLHKRTHMQCNFCKKRFPSIKKKKLHVNYQCDVQKLLQMEPKIVLVRLESLTEVQKKYPKCLDILKESRDSDERGDVKKRFRIRSRSVSDTGSFSNCTSCRGCISVLSEISIGVDKCVQASLIDTDLLLSSFGIVYKDKKRKIEDNLGDNDDPCKKIKLLPPSKCRH